MVTGLVPGLVPGLVSGLVSSLVTCNVGLEFVLLVSSSDASTFSFLSSSENIIKITLFFITTFIFSLSLAFGETPEEKGLRLAIEADLTGEGFIDTVSSSQMTLRNAQGEESIREFSSKTLEVENDGDKSIFIFHHPKDVKGTATLTFTHKTGPDDQWLYLPALKRKIFFFFDFVFPLYQTLFNVIGVVHSGR